MRHYDIAVIGAGPAGIMAAIQASRLKRRVALIESNDAIGRKILVTGKGRCNITNTASIDTFIEKFGKSGRFLRSAFSSFFNTELINFFESNGLRLKTERQGRVFPITDSAVSIVNTLARSAANERIRILYNNRVGDIKKSGRHFVIDGSRRSRIFAQKAILATGGASYRGTGSRGDGFRIAKRFGHTICPLVPALVPLKTAEPWVKELQGLALKNVRITFRAGKKKVSSGIGEILITHFGISGPLVLDLSAHAAALLIDNNTLSLEIDLKPALDIQRLTERLLRDFSSSGKSLIKNVLKGLMPQRLIPVFMKLSDLEASKTASHVTKKERDSILRLLKAIPLTITGTLGIESAMVTGGGVSTKEIDPRTMESRRLPGLYFAGEIIDGCAPSGGYNLQQAFSTGYLAGRSAADA